MPIMKLGQRRQVVIPKDICDALNLQEGDFVEVAPHRGAILVKPKKVVDSDDILTPAEKAMVRKGEAQIRRDEYVTLEELEHDVDRPARKRRRKTA